MALDVIARGMAGEALSEIESGGSSVASYLRGFYYNGEFYYNSTHTQVMPALTTKMYVNITDSLNTLYTYDGTAYVRATSGDGLAVDENGILSLE